MKASSKTLEEIIKTEANRLGFELNGICLPEKPKHYATYLNWVNAGCHAEMSYMTRPDAVLKRSDPCLLLPSCLSIFCVALPYPAPQFQSKPNAHRPLGRISSYALGEDYHTVIKNKLIQLIDFIQSQVSEKVDSLICVDTAPILEKEYAVMSGLGRIGKNSLMITPLYGTYVFLAELLLSLPLLPDEPFSGDPCEHCRRCIEACPVQAIRPDRTIDARRCLSYQTIEQRSDIPLELRSPLSDRIFGCDTCQLVCPYNQPLPAINCDLAFEPKIQMYQDLIKELGLNEDDFVSKFAGTPVMRTHRQGYLRNVITAIGNQEIPEAIQPLKSLLDKEIDPVIRQACQWALARLQAVA